MGRDRPDDERGPRAWAAAVALDRRGAVGDDVALLDLSLRVAGFVVEVAIGDRGPVEAAGGLKVELGMPEVVTFTEVEGVTGQSDSVAPLIRLAACIGETTNLKGSGIANAGWELVSIAPTEQSLTSFKPGHTLLFVFKRPSAEPL